MKKSELQQIIREEISKVLNEKEGPLDAFDFTEILATSMQKNMPKDRWTIKFEDGELVIENDFNEVARYRPVYYRNSGGEQRL